jgi:hypothetical protein
VTTSGRSFLVSFTAGGTDYGPYEVPGTLSVLLGDVDVNLGPIPAMDNNPLAGTSLALALQEILTGPEYFAELDNLGLANTVTAGIQLTDRQVRGQFAAVAQRLAAHMAAWPGDRSFYAPEVPGYAAFLASESRLLKQLTDGLALDKNELHALIHIGQIGPDDAMWRLILSKICALLGIDSSGLWEDRTAFGQMLETFVYQELRRHASWHDGDIRFSHFRDKDGAEVDLVLERGSGQVAGAEVKASATVTTADFRGLRKLKEAAGRKFTTGVVLYDGEASVGFGEGLYAVPIRTLWEQFE